MCQILILYPWANSATLGLLCHWGDVLLDRTQRLHVQPAESLHSKRHTGGFGHLQRHRDRRRMHVSTGDDLGECVRALAHVCFRKARERRQ